jgi:plastocyanin
MRKKPRGTGVYLREQMKEVLDLKRMHTLLAAGGAVAVLAAAGCGGGGGSSSSPSAASAPAASTPAPSSSGGGSSSSGGNTLKISADKTQLKFNTSSLKAKAGTVTITMTNPSQLQHGVAVTGNGVNKAGSVVGNGGSSTVTLKLKPGKYTFYCPVPGHRQAGMQGTLTVQ